MLRELIDKNYKRNPHPYFGKIPEPFSPQFMTALKSAANEQGVLDEAGELINNTLEKERDAMAAEYDQDLDEIWGKGLKKGYNIGLGYGEESGRVTGRLEGLFQGWSDASAYKTPHRVYDLTKATLEPLAAGNTALELANAIPDEPENRQWRQNTKGMAKKGPEGVDLTTYNTIGELPFVLDEISGRLGINLNTFNQPGDDLEGKITAMTETGAKRLAANTKTKKQLAEIVVGKVRQPSGPGNPPRPTRKKAVPKPGPAPVVTAPAIMPAVEAPDPVVEEVTDPPEEVADPVVQEIPAEKVPKAPVLLDELQERKQKIDADLTKSTADDLEKLKKAAASAKGLHTKYHDKTKGTNIGEEVQAELNRRWNAAEIAKEKYEAAKNARQELLDALKKVEDDIAVAAANKKPPKINLAKKKGETPKIDVVQLENTQAGGGKDTKDAGRQ